MRIIMSVNEEVSDYLEGKSNVSYDSSLTLYRHFRDNGHEVYIVHPTQLVSFGNRRGFERLFTVGSRGLEVAREEFEADADVFLVRGLGEDSPDPKKSREFMLALYQIESQVGAMLNDAHSTSFEYKPNQKKLMLPFIPGFEAGGEKDLRKLLEAGEEIIAKPNIGFYGVGIIYLKGPESVGLIPEGSWKDYSFERFMPERTEKRYIFLDGDIIMRRVMKREGPPGKEIPASKRINPRRGEPEEDVVRKAMEMTGMFYGCVDFRQGHVLEINGSGTSTLCTEGGDVLYDIGPSVVLAVEGKI